MQDERVTSWALTRTCTYDRRFESLLMIPIPSHLSHPGLPSQELPISPWLSYTYIAIHSHASWLSVDVPPAALSCPAITHHIPQLNSSSILSSRKDKRMHSYPTFHSMSSPLLQALSFSRSKHLLSDFLCVRWIMEQTIMKPLLGAPRRTVIVLDLGVIITGTRRNTQCNEYSIGCRMSIGEHVRMGGEFNTDSRATLTDNLIDNLGFY